MVALSIQKFGCWRLLQEKKVGGLLDWEASSARNLSALLCVGYIAGDGAVSGQLLLPSQGPSANFPFGGYVRMHMSDFSKRCVYSAMDWQLNLVPPKTLELRTHHLMFLFEQGRRSSMCARKTWC